MNELDKYRWCGHSVLMGNTKRSRQAKEGPKDNWDNWGQTINCFIGSCPELFYGGSHGSDEREVFNELCEIIEEMVRLYEEDGKQLPPPISGKELVNELQKVA